MNKVREAKVYFMKKAMNGSLKLKSFVLPKNVNEKFNPDQLKTINSLCRNKTYLYNHLK